MTRILRALFQDRFAKVVIVLSRLSGGSFFDIMIVKYW